MRKIRFGLIPALLIGWALLGFAGGCGGGPSGGQSEAVNKQNVDDELKAMQNAEKRNPGKGP